jgi:peptidoglycan/xylan/chitin deacetylase (PgdA/CDA1 family)
MTLKFFKHIVKKIIDLGNKKGVVVTYHYINDRTDGFWGKLNKITSEQFEKQLANFKTRGYNFVSFSDYVEFLYGRKNIPNNFCVLTFDDGLRDHWEIVFPILKKWGLTGCFFPLPKSLEGKILPVHKTHILLGELKEEEFAESFNRQLREMASEKYEQFKVDGNRKTNTDRPKRMEEKYKMDGVLRANLKYVIGTMDMNLKDRILSNIFDNCFNGKEAEMAKEFYLSAEQMKEMAENGMEFGAHTVNHPRLGVMEERDQEIEIRESQKMLEGVLGKKVHYFSYPYGSFNRRTSEILLRNGFTAAVTIKEDAETGRVAPFFIRRFDAKNFII